MGNLDDMPKIQVYYNSKSPKQTEYYNNFKKEIIKKIGFIGFSVFDVKNSEFCIKFQYGEETTTVQEKFDGNADAIEKTCKKIETIVNQIKEKEEINKLNAKNKKNDNNIKHNENKNNNNNKNPNINYDYENKKNNKKNITPNIETLNNKNKINEKEKKNNIENKIIIKNEDKLIIDSVRSKEININKNNLSMINNIQIKKNKNKTNNDKINGIQNKESNNKIEKINDIQILNKENNNIICDNINDIQNKKINNKIINDINDIQNKKSNNKIISDKNNDIKRKKNKNKIINDKIKDIQDEENNNNININNNYKFKSNETTVITYYNTRSPKQTEYYNNFKDEIKKKLYINDFSVIDIKKNADFCIKLKCGEEIVTVQERFDGTKNAIEKIRKKIEDLVEIEEKINFNTINENIYNKLQVNNIFDINDNEINNINNKKKKKKKKKKLFRSK